MPAITIHRVRCVLVQHDRYLFVRHNNRRPENFGKWGLPGGILDHEEHPHAALHREFAEEFDIAISAPNCLGDWPYEAEWHRVFVARYQGDITYYDPNEVLEIAWLDLPAIHELAKQAKLHTGYELKAVMTAADRE